MSVAVVSRPTQERKRFYFVDIMDGMIGIYLPITSKKLILILPGLEPLEF